MDLQAQCKEVRRLILTTIGTLGVGHIGGSLSLTELLVVLYEKHMKIDPKNPKMEGRDRLVVSKGHSGPAIYSILCHEGFFDESWLLTLNQPGTNLPSHCDMNRTPGIDMSSGSLGQGISAAAGMALAGKIDNKDYRVYSLLGDGEIEEGQVWEAAMFASHNNLDNLCLIVDFNGLQIDGPVSEVAGPEPIDKKFEAFGFDVQTIDGHDFDAIEAAFARAKTVKGKPSVIIAKTVKGKGVSYMENQVGWHGTAPNKEQYETAMQELTAALHELEGC